MSEHERLMGRKVYSGQRDDDDPLSRGQVRAQERRAVERQVRDERDEEGS